MPFRGTMNPFSAPAVRAAPAPIFIVGSPRSGTSILAWCLGQHSNLLALEESGWMGDLAVDLGVRYAAGSRRGERSQLSAMGVGRDAFMAEFGAAIDNLVARYRSNHSDLLATAGKARWIDGTPEYSLHICALRKLFPAAKFVHIVREVDAVVASMLNFHRLNGEALVAGPADAYAYWLATVGACLAAERALGPEVVRRVRYADLVGRPEPTLRELSEFLGEAYEPACYAPLLTRINSSNVPPDYVIDIDQVAPEQLRAARELSRALQASPVMLDALEFPAPDISAAFEERIRFVAALDGEYAAAQHCVSDLQTELDRSNAWALDCDATLRRRDARIGELQSELAQSTRWALGLERVLNVFGALLIVQCLLLAGAALAGAVDARGAREGLLPLYFATSVAGALAFLWMRRARIRSALRRPGRR